MESKEEKPNEKEEKKLQEEVEKIEAKQNNNSNKFLNTLLAIIVLITLVSGGIVYYALYKYSNNPENSLDDIKSSDSEEQPQESTIADIIDTTINTEPTNEVENTATGSSSSTVTTGDADNRMVLNESIIVLYKGLVLDSDKMGLVELKYIDNTSTTKDDYVITYYNYENYVYKNSTLGTLSTQVVDGLVKIDNVGKIAISEKYEAIPREVQVINSIPAVVQENNSAFANYDAKKTIIIDLDGNGTNEYVVILGNKTTGESKIVLVEATGFVKATIATMNKTGWDGVSTDGYYLSYNNIEILDVDNDGIMEILFEVPTTKTTPTQIDLLKYKNGELSGNTEIECSLKQ